MVLLQKAVKSDMGYMACGRYNAPRGQSDGGRRGQVVQSGGRRRTRGRGARLVSVYGKEIYDGSNQV